MEEKTFASKAAVSSAKDAEKSGPEPRPSELPNDGLSVAFALLK